jgi:succinate-semialdehyde dehydrogenase/glutarate-semialdehyde dehydrogenase
MKQLYIDGRWLPANGNRTYEVKNPATQEVIALVADAGADETKIAITAAQEALPRWSKTPPKERGIILKKAEALVLEKLDSIARTLSLENGKPLEEAKLEVRFASGYLGWFAEEGRRAYGETIPSPHPDKLCWTTLKPIGVVGAITPWNFPANMITRKVAPAIAAGCTIVLKPAEDTPLTALAMAEIFHEAGLPRGVFNLLTAKDPRPISQAFFTNPHIKMISFTGSSAVGKMIMEQSSHQLKRLSLELGGNAPAIVLDDADIEKAATRIAYLKYRRCGGQSCICPNRIYIHKSLYKTFKALFLEKVSSLTVGPGHHPNVHLGPLINQKALDRLTHLIEDTKQRGAKILLGGSRLKDPGLENGFFYAPTVLENAHDDWPICRTEIFGPVANLLPFDTDEEVLRRANDTTYGLASYLFGQNINHLTHLSEHLSFGFVAINDGDGYTHEIPMGGWKESGLGEEGGREGLREYMETKSTLLNLS